jgi:hypothetical protein
MITRVQRVIHSQFIALHVSEPHPERRSGDLEGYRGRAENHALNWENLWS